MGRKFPSDAHTGVVDWRSPYIYTSQKSPSNSVPVVSIAHPFGTEKPR